MAMTRAASSRHGFIRMLLAAAVGLCIAGMAVLHQHAVQNVMPQAQDAIITHQQTINSDDAAIKSETAVVLLAMGNVSHTRMTQRCVYSLTHQGAWHDGHIVIITDRGQHYDSVFARQRFIHVVHANASHLHPTTANASQIPFKSVTMIYKRFKTLVVDYAEATLLRTHILPRLQTILYMDVDIVVRSPLTVFLQQTRPRLQDPGLFLFRDCPTCSKNILNSGIILMHRRHARPCLQAWRHFFDTSPHTTRDQSLLRKVKKFSSRECTLRAMSKQFVLYPNWRDMRLVHETSADDIYPVFIHNSNTYGSTRIPDHIQRQYFVHLLNTTQFATVERF